ncbi:MAG: hypothetical protein ACRDTC_02530 [Pseudonocardiaceae bacterium]
MTRQFVTRLLARMIDPAAAIEAALDPCGLIARNPESRTEEAIRIVGYSPTAARRWRETYATEDEEA